MEVVALVLELFDPFEDMSDLLVIDLDAGRGGALLDGVATGEL